MAEIRISRKSVVFATSGLLRWWRWKSSHGNYVRDASWVLTDACSHGFIKILCWADGLKRWRRRRKGLGIIFARLAMLPAHHLSACLHASGWRLTDWLWINWSICIFGHELFDLHAHADPIDLLVALIDQLTNDQIWCRIFPSTLPQGLSVGPVIVIWINVELIVINPDKCRR